MKYTYILLAVIFIFSCKNDVKIVDEIVTERIQNTYPDNLVKIFDAHGGLGKWQEMEKLSFVLEKPDGDQIITTNLKTRESIVQMPEHIIGNDGDDIWVMDKDDEKYSGNARFHYNLMFYFYAMPFLLADDGINYVFVEDLSYEGFSYPGIGITYDEGIGESSGDMYVIYYNPETFMMEWLGYTVTFFGKDDNGLHFRRYNDWIEKEGLKLPSSITRYYFDNNKPTDIHSVDRFSNIQLSKVKMTKDEYKMPANGYIVK